MAESTSAATYRVDREALRRDWPAWLALAASFVGGALAFPLLNAALYGIMLLAPLFDPRRANYVQFAGFYRGLRLLLALFLAGLHATVLAARVGIPIGLE